MYRVNPDLRYRPIGDRLLAVNAVTGVIYSLSGAAANAFLRTAAVHGRESSVVEREWSPDDEICALLTEDLLVIDTVAASRKPTFMPSELAHRIETACASLGAAVPVICGIEITLRCDLGCRHCYRSRRRPDSISSLTLPGILDQLSAAGCLFLVLTGGEPTLHPEFVELVDIAARKGFGVFVNSAGHHLTDAICGKLAEVRCLGLYVSFYGAEPVTHDYFTRTPGSFDRSLEGLARLRRVGVPATFKAILTKYNHRELDSMRQLADRYECDFEYYDLIYPTDDGIDEPLRYAIRPPSEGQSVGAMLTNPEGGREGTPGITRFTCKVASDGTVQRCCVDIEPVGSIFEQPFNALWTALTDSTPLNANCGSCLAKRMASYGRQLERSEMT